MLLSPSLLQELQRLGAVVDQSTPAEDACQQLIHYVQWPEGIFMSAVARMRQLLAEEDEDEDYDQWDDEEIIEEYDEKCYRNLRFNQTPGAFYDGWETEFTGVPDDMIPWAADEVDFFFLGTNKKNPSDPLVYVLDHEEIRERPWNRGEFTVAYVLSWLIPVDGGG